MRTKLVYADQILKNPQEVDGNYLGGFNSRLHGESYTETARGAPSAIGPRSSGWTHADDMIRVAQKYEIDRCDI